MSTQEQELTKIETDVLGMLRESYKEHGSAYSGCIPANATAFRNYASEGDELWAAIDHMIHLGLVQRRNCQGLAYELTVAQRLELIDGYDLSDYWQLVGQGPGGDEYSEILHVRAEVAKQRAPCEPTSL